MDVIVRSSDLIATGPHVSGKSDPSHEKRSLCVGDSVAYYSGTHQKWIKTSVVRIRSDRVVDLACRKNVDSSLLVRSTTASVTSSGPDFQVENRSPVNTTSSTSAYVVGTRVEYLSESMNAWVRSIVRGYNDDGSYVLNIKKSAPASRVRILVPTPPSGTLDKPSAQVGFLSVVHVDGQSKDLEGYAARILTSLNLTFDHTVSRMRGLTGGQNDGIYFISGPPNNARKLCLKVVRTDRLFPSVQTERERYMELLRNHPSSLVADKHITFPYRILQLQSKQSTLCDVIVMNCARGERMAELLGRLVSAVDWSALSSVFERVGTQLKNFHTRYKGMQHGDLQVSNIYVDKESVVFIDVGGMSHSGDDVDYFLKSISILAKTYGIQFQSIATSSFNRGYCIK